MNTHDDQFLKSLRATFKVEAMDHVESIANGLMALEKTTAAEETQGLIETVFRSAHSLKGAARAVNFTAIESVCQALEDVFAAWKRRESTPSVTTFDAVHRALDAISELVDHPEQKSDQALASHVRALRSINSQRAAVIEPEQRGVADEVLLNAGPVVPADIDKTVVPETVRIGVTKLDARLLEAEEMLAAKLVTGQRESELRALLESMTDWRKAWAKVQPAIRVLRQSTRVPVSAPASSSELGELIEFFDSSHNHFQSLESRLATLTRTAAQDSLFVGKLVDDLLEDSKKLLMLPLSTLSVFMQKLVRDLCRDQGKQAQLSITGENIEIDKRVLEAMKDPLIHIIRNCVDHGLETPEQRQRQGKTPRARITVTVTRLNGDKVELAIADDGNGIDLERLKSAAVKQEVISRAEANRISNEDALALVFRADVSTSPLITQLSGRGLGLAIVREQTEKLGGTVAVESRNQVGTTIRITLPITLRTFRGIMVKAGNQLFVLPTTQVRRVARFKPEDVQTIEGREALILDRCAVPLIHLTAVLELADTDQNGDMQASRLAVVLGITDEQIAFVIDALLGEQELPVKRFGKLLSRVRNVAGATVLGSGQVAPILNVSDLLKSAKKITGRTTVFGSAEPAGEQTKSILLVEDSITSRMLLKGILESAGYEVKTAVDGLDAFTTLRTEPFDLVVSDVEMPRLNGFDLTARIRADDKLSELPVILVTALETREDRERGVDVGASAYLVKSSFDQSNLLEAVHRLA
jgi:two-component system chemotaxis sensor kinase CheA